MPGPLPAVRVLLVGARGVGKSTVILRLAEIAAQRGRIVSGLLNFKRVEGGEVVGIDGIDLGTDERFPFADAGEGTADSPVAVVGPFRFRAEGIGRALRALGDWRGSDLHVFDEVGRLELRGEGLAGALPMLADPAIPRLIAVARDELAEQVARLARGIDWETARVTEANRDRLPVELADRWFPV